MSKTQLKSNSRLELYETIKNLNKKVQDLERKLTHTKVVIGEQRSEKMKLKRKITYKEPLQSGRPRLEELSETRKRQIGQKMAKNLLSEILEDTHSVVANDIGKLILKISDFSSREKIPLRGLGILLYVSNFKRIRRKMIFKTGFASLSWYSGVMKSLVKSGMIVVDNKLTRVAEYMISDEGKSVVNKVISEIKECIDVKETKGIETRDPSGNCS
jgi:hypothetical protein